MAHNYQVKMYPPQCEAHAREVHVEYLGKTRDGVHNFSVTSLSQPGKEWNVEVLISKRFNNYPKGSLTPEDLFKNKLIRMYSTDPSWKWWSSNFLSTINSTALYASFRAPKVHDVAYVCCHPSLSVLELVCDLGPGVIDTVKRFSADCKWDDESERFTFSNEVLQS